MVTFKNDLHLLKHRKSYKAAFVRASELTRRGAVVCNEAGHVHGPAVDLQVSHASHKVSVPHREVLWQVGNSTQKQRTGQVQRSVQVNESGSHDQEPL